MDRLRNAMPSTSGGSGGINWKSIASYFFDYAIIVALAVAYSLLDKFLQPNQQRFSLNNISLQYKIADPERVPIHTALLYSAALPILIIAVYTMVIDGLFSHRKHNLPRIRRYTLADRLWELNCGVLGLLLAQGAAFVITGSLKNLIGKPRPDFIDRCQPISGARDAVPWGLSNSTICTQKDPAIMQDGYRSFPSGHSSSSFAGLFFLSLYLAAKLHVLDQRGEVWRTVIVLIPTLGAAMIAGSRIIDARHHPFDVLFGSALGILCGWAAYRQYFPPVSHTWEKGRAYPMRLWGVPLKRPEGTMSADGQVYNYHGALVDATHASADDHEEGTSIGMEPMRRSKHFSSASAPSFQEFQRQTRRSSPDHASGGNSSDDTSYEHIRVKGDNVTSNTMVPERLGAQTRENNQFREQVNRNNVMRDFSDINEERDLGYRGA